ncbi:uncharacterized protein LOC130858438 [Hippopotamus amphibius kiboko]|uniref:uncharacterized protein LOC130858438 n=1 Tax=Hippopotamus amphibius kiboko TaxID=575201 RepID=UPI0025996939|nr:uncharacterized protein LOC130858438 [Hippopotamus amphibius kiboko]
MPITGQQHTYNLPLAMKPPPLSWPPSYPPPPAISPFLPPPPPLHGLPPPPPTRLLQRALPTGPPPLGFFLTLPPTPDPSASRDLAVQNVLILPSLHSAQAEDTPAPGCQGRQREGLPEAALPTSHPRTRAQGEGGGSGPRAPRSAPASSTAAAPGPSAWKPPPEAGEEAGRPGGARRGERSRRREQRRRWVRFARGGLGCGRRGPPNTSRAPNLRRRGPREAGPARPAQGRRARDATRGAWTRAPGAGLASTWATGRAPAIPPDPPVPLPPPAPPFSGGKARSRRAAGARGALPTRRRGPPPQPHSPPPAARRLGPQRPSARARSARARLPGGPGAARGPPALCFGAAAPPRRR